MKYSMVKQFSNASVDNAFKFFFKIIDFGKILIEVFWGLFDIFAAFYLIFFNLFMYFYYLLLYVLDRGSESSGTYAYKAKRSASSFQSNIPSVSITSGPSPIPSMYKSKGTTSGSSISQMQSSPKVSAKGGGAKKNIFKTIGEAIVEFFIFLKKAIAKPFIIIKDFFSAKLKPVKETSKPKDEEVPRTTGKRTKRSSGTSLIDEYMKEYNKGKK